MTELIKITTNEKGIQFTSDRTKIYKNNSK